MRTAARMSGPFGAVVVAVCLSGAGVHAQSVERLSLKDAEQQALKSHPLVAAGQIIALAGAETVREARSAYFPTIYASVTGAEAQSGSRIAAGGLNNPIILDRLAAGLTATQLLTDFGRTSDLVKSANLREAALQQDVATDRATVLLAVDHAYFSGLRAQAVLRVAQDTVNARQLVVDQVTALAAGNLRSGLDVSFARVSLGQAQLLLVQAQNEVQAAFARLSAALGTGDSKTFELDDQPLPPDPAPDSADLVARALRERPDAVAARLSQQSASKFADAERALWFPTISAAGAAGVVPYQQAGLASPYSAVGINLSVPVLNGGLFSARRADATLRASAEEQRVRDLENRVARDVRLAWLDVRTGFQRLDLTDQILAEATQALDLAQTRYNLGLSSIVELSQAQLNKTQAEIDQATARYEYGAMEAALRFQTGELK
jgi:outer membrane protein